MCRLLGYLGTPMFLETLLTQPEHSLVVQSYDPQEMTAGLINADGFGLGWYPFAEKGQPYRYRNILPIWNDPNLVDLSRYVQADCFLAAIRSATLGQSLQWSNCQPFQQGHLLGIHNGFIDNFRQTLWRPMYECLSDQQAQAIAGSTDSEHIFALICHQLQMRSHSSLATALANTLGQIATWADSFHTCVSLNVILSDGDSLVASRFAYPEPPPSLYWSAARQKAGIIVASESLDGRQPSGSGAGDHWLSLPENSLLTVDRNFNVKIDAL